MERAFYLQSPLKVDMQSQKLVKRKDGTRVRKPNFFPLNLNTYRNANYHILNKAKVLYKEAIKNEILKLPNFKIIRIEYTVFLPSKRETDINNIVSVLDKFFSDALVELGKLEDDNYKYLIGTSSSFGGIDSSNPRAEIKIIEMS